MEYQKYYVTLDSSTEPSLDYTDRAYRFKGHIKDMYIIMYTSFHIYYRTPVCINVQQLYYTYITYSSPNFSKNLGWIYY